MNNCELCKKIIQVNNPDVICLTEMHLKMGEDILLGDYTYYGVNRPSTNNKGSGGVGILV